MLYAYFCVITYFSYTHTQWLIIIHETIVILMIISTKFSCKVWAVSQVNSPSRTLWYYRGVEHRLDASMDLIWFDWIGLGLILEKLEWIRLGVNYCIILFMLQMDQLSVTFPQLVRCDRCKMTTFCIESGGHWNPEMGIQSWTGWINWVHLYIFCLLCVL